MGFETGKVQKKNRSAGKGTRTYTDGNPCFIGGKNTVGLALAGPSAYLGKNLFKLPIKTGRVGRIQPFAGPGSASVIRKYRLAPTSEQYRNRKFLIHDS